MRGVAGACLIAFAAGCHSPVSDLATLNVPVAKPGDGWYQVSDGPQGFTFQIPKGWFVQAGMPGEQNAAPNESGPGAILVFLPETSVPGAVTIFGVEELEEEHRFLVSHLDSFRDWAQKEMSKTVTNVRSRKVALPVGPAYELSGTRVLNKAGKGPINVVCHEVVFTTATRSYMVTYMYNSLEEATYLPRLEAMLKLVRVVARKVGGSVDVPAWAIRSVSSPVQPVGQDFQGPAPQSAPPDPSADPSATGAPPSLDQNMQTPDSAGPGDGAGTPSGPPNSNGDKPSGPTNGQ